MDYKRNFYEIVNNEEIFSKIQLETKSVGYYSLPFQETKSILKYTQKVNQSNIFVIGIGGSSLGSKSIYNFLVTSRKLPKSLNFLDTIDPLKVSCILDKTDLLDSHFVIISKSGNTIEPISLMKYIDSKIKLNSLNATIISELGTPLHSFSVQRSIKHFEIPKSVGGRFSVFSNAGLVPLAMVGIDINELLKGCREVHESFFSRGFYHNHILNKARFLVENKSRFTNNVIFSYSSIFEFFNKWFFQIWAESLGKKNINGTRQGLTPITLLGPEDQHSFLQLIIDGPRNKTVTFFKVENLGIDSSIPGSPDYEIFNSEYLQDTTFNELINYQADSTVEAILNEKDIPCDVITISKVDEFNIATLMYRYQLLVSCIGSFLQIDAYNQPGVEFGKESLRKKLVTRKHD